MKMSYKQQLAHPLWQKKRLEILERDNWACAWCGVTDKMLHIHHLCYSKGKMAWEAENDSLIAICKDCHEVSHLKNLTEFENNLIQLIKINAMTGNPYSQNILNTANEVVLKHKSNG